MLGIRIPYHSFTMQWWKILFMHCHILNLYRPNLSMLYVGVSNSFETSSIDRQPMAIRECVRYAWEQRTSPLSMPSGVAVWTLGVAQHECLSPCVPSHLRFQHGRENGAESKQKILHETRQTWRGDFWNDTTCLWKWGHEACEVFRVTRGLQERQNITRRRREVRANFHELKT